MGKTLPYSYRAYGLHLQSALELPELTPYPGWDRSGADSITIRLGSVAPLLGETEDEHRLYHATAEEVTIAYSGVGRFLIQGGTQIVVDAVPGMEEAELRVYLLGVALAILLHQRGLLVLHASGVSIEGGAVLFLGAKGYGKSTMAAAMQELGHPLIADDVVPISMKSRIEAYPGFPQLKLWPESVKALGRYPEELPKLYSEVDKRKQVAEHFVHEEVLPLRAIFVLSHGDELRIDTLSSRDAFAELIRHSFVSKFLHEMSSTTTHFSQCVRLLEQKPLLYLQRPKKLTLLKEVAQLVEQYAVMSEVVT